MTILVNAIYVKTGGINFLGPNFSSLGNMATQRYTLENLRNVIMDSGERSLKRSEKWQKQRGKALAKTRPWKVLQSGRGEGILMGGNLGTFYLLQGTPYQPRFDRPTILVVEDDDQSGKYSAREFDRRLESILQIPGARQNLRGLLIGRFQPGSKVTSQDIEYIVGRLQLGDIPVVANMDFGHTAPMLTLPIGGTAIVKTENNQARLNLLK